MIIDKALIYSLPRLKGNNRDYLLDIPIDKPWNNNNRDNKAAKKAFFI
jgi:hypothetical protein